MMVKDIMQAVLKNLNKVQKHEDGSVTIWYNFDDTEDLNRNITFSSTNGDDNFISMESSAELRDMEKFIIQILKMCDIQSMEEYEGYKMVSYGDDLDPSFIIHKDNQVVLTGTNGFSDGYVFKLEDWVKQNTQSF